MERVLKPITALIVATVVAATFTQAADAATKSRHDSNQSGWTSGPDYTQSGPNHTGPLYRGYPMSDWYIY